MVFFSFTKYIKKIKSSEWYIKLKRKKRNDKSKVKLICNQRNIIDFHDINNINSNNYIFDFNNINEFNNTITNNTIIIPVYLDI